MRMTWHDLLFAHWPVAPEVLRARIPSGLQLDTIQGSAWLAVVPFRMSGVTPRGVPALPWLSAFPELNVRTYVTVGDKPGVYFFSLDAGNPVAVAVARRCFHLPYFRARMAAEEEGAGIRYRSERTHRGAPDAQFEGSYQPVGDALRAQPGSLEHWLTERYCLYAVDPRGQVFRGEIHHSPWPLQPAEAEIRVETMARSHGILLPGTRPLLHFARRLEVVAWAPEGVAIS
jgi:uncharacterized protein YqjF (DUF2071 family)